MRTLKYFMIFMVFSHYTSQIVSSVNRSHTRKYFLWRLPSLIMKKHTKSEIT